MAVKRIIDPARVAVEHLKHGARIKLAVARTHRLQFNRAAALMLAALHRGRKLIFFGNGGSAADAQHLATEFTGRFMRPNRRALPAIALTTDTSALTAIGNDYGYRFVFSRQLEALVQPGDVVFAITTSGKSPNVLEAITTARNRGASVIGFTGARGRAFARRCDVAFVVPADTSPRIQEAHIAIGHILCEVCDSEFANE